jgi:hypothetical protein
VKDTNIPQSWYSTGGLYILTKASARPKIQPKMVETMTISIVTGNPDRIAGMSDQMYEASKISGIGISFPALNHQS